MRRKRHDKPHLPEPSPEPVVVIRDDPFQDEPERWVGRRVSFDHPIGNAAGQRLVGVVESHRFIGRTQRGNIPDYLLTIRGKSGKIIETSLVESYASIE